MKHKHHIIPKHMGGTNDPSNIAELTVEEHAEAHKRLYEEYGRWQDYVAWQGLSGRIGKEEIIQMKNKMAHLGKESWNKGLKGYKAGEEHYRWGKKLSSEITQKISNTLEGNECRAKTYIVKNILTGENLTVKNLKRYCKENGLPYNSVNRSIHVGCVYRKTYRFEEVNSTT